MSDRFRILLIWPFLREPYLLPRVRVGIAAYRSFDRVAWLQGCPFIVHPLRRPVNTQSYTCETTKETDRHSTRNTVGL